VYLHGDPRFKDGVPKAHFRLVVITYCPGHGPCSGRTTRGYSHKSDIRPRPKVAISVDLGMDVWSNTLSLSR